MIRDGTNADTERLLPVALAVPAVAMLLCRYAVGADLSDCRP